VSPRYKLEPAYVYEEQPISKLEIGQKTVDLSSFHLKLAKTTSEFNNSHHQRSVEKKQKHMGTIMEQIDRIRFTPPKPQRRRRRNLT
jgi:hypothetical protein